MSLDPRIALNPSFNGKCRCTFVHYHACNICVSGYMIMCHGKALDITRGEAKTFCCKKKEVLKSKTRIEITIKKRRQPKDESVLKQKLCF